MIHTDRCINNILQHTVMWEQMKALKNQSEVLADLLQLILMRIDAPAVLLPHSLLTQIDQFPAIHGLKHRGTAQQCGLSGAGRPYNRYDLTLLHGQRNVFQDLKRAKCLF